MINAGRRWAFLVSTTSSSTAMLHYGFGRTYEQRPPSFKSGHSHLYIDTTKAGP